MTHGILFHYHLEQQHAEVKSNQAIYALLKKAFLFEILTLTLENEAKL